MVLLGVEIDNALVRKDVASMILDNSEKPVVKILFNVGVYCVGDNLLIIRKDFIAEKTMNVMFSIMLLISAVPWFVWDVSVPLFIVAGIIALWGLLSSRIFNFFMFKIMIRTKLHYKGSLRLL